MRRIDDTSLVSDYLVSDYLVSCISYCMLDLKVDLKVDLLENKKIEEKINQISDLIHGFENPNMDIEKAYQISSYIFLRIIANNRHHTPQKQRQQRQSCKCQKGQY